MGAAGKIMSAQRAAQLLDESPTLPVTADYLRQGGLSERFINHIRGRPQFVLPESV